MRNLDMSDGIINAEMWIYMIFNFSFCRCRFIWKGGSIGKSLFFFFLHEIFDFQHLKFFLPCFTIPLVLLTLPTWNPGFSPTISITNLKPTVTVKCTCKISKMLCSVKHVKNATFYKLVTLFLIQTKRHVSIFFL